MTMEDTGVSSKDALDDEVLTKMTIELGPNLKELHTMYSGYEHVKAIITHVQRYAAEKLGNLLTPTLIPWIHIRARLCER